METSATNSSTDLDKPKSPRVISKMWIFFGFFAILHFSSVLFIVKTHADVSPIQDALEYKILGQNLLAGNGFSVSSKPPFEQNLLRTPMYLLFLATTYALENSGILAIFIQQIMLLASGFLLLKIFLHYKKENLGFIFTALFLLEPLQWMLSLQTMSETLFTLLTIYCLYLALAKLATDKIIHGYFYSGLLGITLGIAILTRPSGTLWLPGLVLGMLTVTRDSWRTKFIRIGILILAVSIIVTPWIYRNYKLTGRPLLSSSYEYNIVIGFGNDAEIAELQAGPDIFDARGRRGYDLVGLRAGFYPRLKNIAASVAERTGSDKIITTQIMAAGKIWFNSRYNTILDMAHKGTANSSYGKVVVVLDYIFWTLLLILCILGIFEMASKRLWPLMLATSAIILANAIITLTVSYTRMRIPILPEIFLLSGFGVALVSRLNKSKERL